MGSKRVSRGAGALPESGRVVIVGENSRNAAMMGDALAGVAVDAVDPGEARDAIGTSHIDAVVVDAGTVTRGVTRLVRDVRERGIPVVLLAESPSPSVRRNAAGVDGMAFAEKPVRSERFCGLVTDALA